MKASRDEAVLVPSEKKESRRPSRELGWSVDHSGTADEFRSAEYKARSRRASKELTAENMMTSMQVHTGGSGHASRERSPPKQHAYPVDRPVERERDKAFEEASKKRRALRSTDLMVVSNELKRLKKTLGIIHGRIAEKPALCEGWDEADDVVRNLSQTDASLAKQLSLPKDGAPAVVPPTASAGMAAGLLIANLQLNVESFSNFLEGEMARASDDEWKALQGTAPIEEADGKLRKEDSRLRARVSMLSLNL